MSGVVWASARTWGFVKRTAPLMEHLLILLTVLVWSSMRWRRQHHYSILFGILYALNLYTRPVYNRDYLIIADNEAFRNGSRLSLSLLARARAHVLQNVVNYLKRALFGHSTGTKEARHIHTTFFRRVLKSCRVMCVVRTRVLGKMKKEMRCIVRSAAETDTKFT